MAIKAKAHEKLDETNVERVLNRRTQSISQIAPKKIF